MIQVPQKLITCKSWCMLRVMVPCQAQDVFKSKLQVHPSPNSVDRGTLARHIQVGLACAQWILYVHDSRHVQWRLAMCAVGLGFGKLVALGKV
eukprot:5416556-Lingulodinium_polyedra.AAC.1